MSAGAWLDGQLGRTGAAALAILAVAVAAHLWLVRPQEERLAGLREALASRTAAARLDLSQPQSAAARLAAFHDYFQRDEPRTDWLAKLYGTARANGFELRSAEYRFVAAQGRLERYQVSVPLTGSYPRLRRFIEDALVEIPVMSLDQAAFRRKRAVDAQVEADLTFTLYLPRR